MEKRKNYTKGGSNELTGRLPFQRKKLSESPSGLDRGKAGKRKEGCMLHVMVLRRGVARVSKDAGITIEQILAGLGQTSISN